MKRKTMRLVLGLAVALAFGAAWGDITVKSGETILVGTTGKGINNKNDGSVITLEAGATLKGTNDPPYSSWTIWRNLYATNGLATLDCSEMNYVPQITKHAVLTDGLVVTGNTSVVFQDNNAPDAADWYIRDLAGVSFAGGGGNVKLCNQATLVSTPSDTGVSVAYSTTEGTASMRALAIAGPGLRLAQIQNDPADFTGFAKVYLFDDAYIPAGHSIAVGGKVFRIHPATVDRATRRWVSVAGSGVVTHPISLDGGTLELFAPLNTGYAFTGKVSGSATINFRRDSAPSVTSCSFAELDGNFTFVTWVTGRTMEVSVAKLAPGSMLDDAGVVNITLSAEDAARVSVVESSSGAKRYIMPGADGRIPVSQLPDASRRLSEHALLSGEVTLAGMPETKVGADEGARVSIAHDGTRSLTVVPDRGTVVVTSGVSESLPLFWFDASLPYDWSNHGRPYYSAPASDNTSGKDFGNIIMTNGFPYVEGWFDRRGSTAGKFRLTRYYDGQEYKFYAHSYPYLAVGAGPNGLSYLDFGVYNVVDSKMSQTNHTDAIAASTTYAAKRRIDFTRSPAPGSVIMVFGSQKGGGLAVLGTGSKHLFRRTGRALSDALVATAPANTTFWLDGAKVADPTAQTFNGGWQILSISGDAVKETIAIGSDASYQDAGGQNYGEIIFFADALTDGVRERYERYLAKKWGIDGYAGARGDVIRAEGRGGTLELAGDDEMDLRGTFAGKVTLAGAKVVLSEPLPPTAGELPAEGRLHWFDADEEGAVRTMSEANGGLTFTNAVRGIIARGTPYSDVQEGDLYLYGAGGRTPFCRRERRGLAAERTWIDFNHPAGYTPTKDDGNTLRFATFDSRRMVTYPAKTGIGQTFRTAFMAMDSSMGGGTPLLSAVLGSSGDFRSRDASSYRSALWTASCAPNVTGGVTRVNGTRVNATERDALTGDAETLTLTTAGDVTAAFVDCLNSTQSTPNGAPTSVRSNGLIFGELLLYTTELAAADIAKVEAYLQGKWTGTLPEGYSDLREATIDGTGTVAVADSARLPRIAPTFVGSVAVGGESASLAFAIDGEGAVDGALLTPGATYDLPPSVTLNVTAPGAFPAGRYDLIVCAGLAQPVAWSLNVNAAKRRVCDLVTETKDGVTRVTLNVENPGFLLIVR